ncbi:MAG: hypothetical protein JXR64_11125 [Spirochaetales bacterium]|nr:hypothetical protein [Spirochaetales bacterium]
MFTLSKTCTDLTYESNAYKLLGSQLVDYGSRILLISSQDPKDQFSIKLIKDQLTKAKLTYIESSQKEFFVNKESFIKLQERAETFSVQLVLSVGDFPQIMSGRYISQSLNLNCFEILLTPYIPYLFIPKSLYATRVGNDFGTINISPERVTSILIDPTILRKFEELEIIIITLSMLFDIAQIFLDPENNIISITESRNLFERILVNLENNIFRIDDLIEKSLTASLYHGASTNTELELTLFSLLAGQRFNIDYKYIKVKLLPWLLLEQNENLSIRVREYMDRHNLPFRLAEFSISKQQLLEICPDNIKISKIINTAY